MPVALTVLKRSSKPDFTVGWIERSKNLHILFPSRAHFNLSNYGGSYQRRVAVFAHKYEYDIRKPMGPKLNIKK